MSSIPRVLCACGCGNETRIATETHRRKGIIKGQPLRYIMGHSGNRFRAGPRPDRRLPDQICEQCGISFYAHRRQRYCCLACRDAARRPSARFCAQCGAAFVSSRKSKQFCGAACMRAARRKGSRWRSGVQAWREAVYQRDKVCRDCGETENLQAHHIRGWVEYPAGRLDPANGMLLCFACHRRRHGHAVGIGGKGWDGQERRCTVCGVRISRKTASGLCRSHSHSKPQPQRRKGHRDNYRKGLTCAVCGVAIHNLSKTGRCRLHFRG